MPAMISLLVLILAGPASAQDWHPSGKPQPLPSTLQKMEPVTPPAAGKVVQPPEDIIRVAAQVGMKSRTGEDDYEFTLRLEPPGIQEMSQRKSEQAFFQTIGEEVKKNKPGAARVYFPEHEPATTKPYTGRQFAYMPKLIEPHYVCHKPLWFEQPNFERHGWDLGPITGAVNIGMFYYDLIMLPYHVGQNVCRCYDCSAGKCLPGDPTPLLLYRERFSVTGLIFETTVIGGGFFAFP
jgi:hypothetical protein